SLARFAVRTRIDALHAQAFRRTLRRPTVHGLLTRAVLTQHLTHEHRQRERRRIQPFAVLGQQRIGHLQQLRGGEQIEKIHSLHFTTAAAEVLGMLLRKKLGITIAQGWPSRWLRCCVVTTSYQSRWSAFSFNFNRLAISVHIAVA